MRLPVAVEASVADELRTWLSFELEQLGASSTSQFAHHVVTILLHEDLDIEDEPLSSGDDFLTDIYSMRQTKTREKRKKAAVQFLRRAVCYVDKTDNTTDTVIMMIVDELMQKIDATKVKMQSRKASKRSLLSPLVVNVDSLVKKSGAKNRGAANEQKYNEAFPSLSEDVSPGKEAQASVGSNAYGWNKSPGAGKENQRKQVRRKVGSRCTLLFRSAEDAWACDVARESAASVLDDVNFSAKEAMEVWAPSHHTGSSQSLADPPTFCWKSAFSRTSLMTRAFSPSVAPLLFPAADPKRRGGYEPREILPVILGDKERKTHPECIHMDALSFWEDMGFLPIPSMLSRQAQDRERRRKVVNVFKPPNGKFDADAEVKFFLGSSDDDDDDDDGAGSNNKESDDGRTSYPVDDLLDKLELKSATEEVEGAVAFPSHYGSYWQEMISQGHMSLYPSFENAQHIQDDRDRELQLKISSIWADPSTTEENYQPGGECGSIGQHDWDGSTTAKDRKKKHQALWFSATENKFVPLENGYWNGAQTFFLDERQNLTSESERENCRQTRRCKDMGPMMTEADYPTQTWTGCTPEQHVEDDAVFGDGSEGAWGHDPVEDRQGVAWNTPWGFTPWNNINRDIVDSIMRTKPATPNPFLPPRLASCLPSEHSQFLQSAFVNSIFSSHPSNAYMQAWKPQAGSDQQVDAMQFLGNQNVFDAKVLPVELVKGTTCSNWLENNCKRGLLCPFSHPNI